jgi:hypothetical protein
MTDNKTPLGDAIARGHGRDIEHWVQATRKLTEPVQEDTVTKATHEAVSTRADLQSVWPE